MKIFRLLVITVAMTMASAGAVHAAAPAATAAAAPSATKAPAPAAPAPAAASADGSLPGYTPMAPTAGIGQPQTAEYQFQKQFNPNGQYADWINGAILTPIIVAISIVVLALLLFVMVRFRRAANPVASKTSHNSVIEVIWTAVPVLILLVIAVPSFDLLARQYVPASKNAITIKATGYQWYWGYTYPDFGGFEVISNILPEKADAAPGKRYRTDRDGPRLLAVDNRMVVPANYPLRIQTTGADVIHSFGVPSLWFKLDAVPGRINERSLTIDRPGVYFGQCSQLCGARHGFMPISIEALPMPKFLAWIKAKGGTIPKSLAAFDTPAAIPVAAQKLAVADHIPAQPAN